METTMPCRAAVHALPLETFLVEWKPAYFAAAAFAEKALKPS